MNDNSLEALLQDFVDEARLLSSRLGDAMLEVERRWQQKAGAEKILPRIKADLHTLKGNSGLMGLTALQALTHTMEDLCGVLMEEKTGSEELADLLLAGTDQLTEMVELSARGELQEGHADDILRRLEKALCSFRKSEHSHGKNRSEKPGVEGIRGSSAIDDMVRIDFHKLDNLLEMVGEAMISRSMLVDAHKCIDVHGSPSSDLETAMQLLERSLRKLQEGLVETRLLPVSMVFRRFVRQVRDQARQDGKTVRLKTQGGDTTIDKTIIDRLGEPLLHLVRNAIAHGIEPTETRKKLGKPEEAEVRLSARQDADRVLISVSDDGRGLDMERIRSKAGELGYDTTAMTREEILNLIFKPSFSTANRVTTLAGRGVGLDVVAASIEALGGAVSVETTTGAGATFHLDLPLTLAVVNALFVEIEEEHYILPLSYVLESFRVDPDTIHIVAGREVVVWREELLPIVDARNLLGTGRKHGTPFCVVVTAGSNRCGLLVQSIRNRQDVVVKGLDGILGRQELISGVTTMGDGRIVFILDVSAVVNAGIGTGNFRTSSVAVHPAEHRVQ